MAALKRKDYVYFCIKTRTKDVQRLRSANFARILTETELRYSLMTYTTNYTEGSSSEPTTPGYCRLACFIYYLNLTRNTLLRTAEINMSGCQIE